METHQARGPAVGSEAIAEPSVYAEVITRHADVQGERAAVKDSRTVLTWTDLDREVRKFSEYLGALDVNVGDPVLLLIDACVESVVAYWAVRRLGAVAVVADPGCKQPEFEHLIGSTGAGVVISTRAGTLDRVRAETNSSLLWLAQEHDYATHDVADNRELELRSWRRLQGTSAAQTSRLETVPDAAVVLFSSGTTGTPKTIVHTEASITAFHETQARSWKLSPRDVVLGALPFHTVYGSIFSAASTIYNGATLVLMERFKPELALEIIERERVTTAALVPTMVLMMLNVQDRERFDLSSLRMTITGSAPIDESDVARFAEYTGAPLLATYGMTECPGAATERSGNQHRPGSAGQICDGFEACARDEEGQPLPPGEEGEITMRGPTMMYGYLHQPELTAARIKDGWIYTEDTGAVDAEGHIYVLGRASDMIIRGGLNIAPSEVESALQAHPGVIESAVVGMDDPIYGQVVRAYVVLKPSYLRSEIESELQAHCEKQLSRAKVPAVVVLMRDLPMNAGGKVVRGALAEAESSARIWIAADEEVSV